MTKLLFSKPKLVYTETMDLPESDRIKLDLIRRRILEKYQKELDEAIAQALTYRVSRTEVEVAYPYADPCAFNMVVRKGPWA